MIWLNLVQLSRLPQFSQILDQVCYSMPHHCHLCIVCSHFLSQVSRNERGWKAWFDKEAPEEAQIPDGYRVSLHSFQKLMLIR